MASRSRASGRWRSGPKGRRSARSGRRTGVPSTTPARTTSPTPAAGGRTTGCSGASRAAARPRSGPRRSAPSRTASAWRPTARGSTCSRATRAALVEVPILPDGAAGARRVLCDLDPAVPDGVAPMEDGGFLIACYRPDAVLRWHPDEGLSTFAEDVRGTVLAAPTNIAFVGEHLDDGDRPEHREVAPDGDPAARERHPAELSGHPVSERIEGLQVATVRAALPEPIHFGDWVMKHREFALVRVRAESGLEGFAFTLTREGPIAATIHRAIAHHYVGSTVATQDDAARIFYRCQGSNLAGLASGIGLRALSIVDLAVHDLLARSAGLPIARWLGGEPRRLPATAIIGYPPARDGSGRRRRAGPRLCAKPAGGASRSRSRSRSSTAATGCSPRAKPPAPTRGSGWTPPGSSARWTTPSRSWTTSVRHGSRGSRTSSRRVTQRSSPASASGRTCRSRWATSRAAATTPRRSSCAGRSTSSASTSPAWGESRAPGR